MLEIEHDEMNIMLEIWVCLVRNLLVSGGEEEVNEYAEAKSD